MMTPAVAATMMLQAQMASDGTFGKVALQNPS
jgi:hypothetical protein